MDQRFAPISWLKEASHRAYLVGNQSRSKLLGVSYDPKDIDIATDALPDLSAAVVRRHGIIPVHVDDNFGVVSFTWLGNAYEITTFRCDIYDAEFDHIKRAPKQVIFVDSLEQDAARRDFTINAIYWDPATGRILDPVGGRYDLTHKFLRVIGDPDIRFKEDPVRILRAIRFKHDLGLRYDRETRAALKRQAKLIHKMSAQTLKKEFQKIQNLPRYSAARRDMQQLGIIGRF